jgi:oxygen-dependent protoporphyrinogen oxidase
MEALARPMTSAPRVAIVGGGVTGLAAAFALRRARPDVEVVVFEARDRLGGNIQTERQGNFVIDAGPDSFIRTKPEALVLCRELGIDSELLPTNDAARHVFVVHRGRLAELPGGMALAVPTRIGPLWETPLLSAAGKLRLLAEPFVPKKANDEDESIESFFTRRVGKEAATRLAGPLLGGIYAGDVSRLGIRGTFPQLVALEKTYGSLLRGFLAQELSQGGSTKPPSAADVYRWLRRAGTAQAPSPFLSFKNGMGTLIDALERALPSDAVRAGAPVESVIPLAGGGFTVRSAGASLVADAVILAAPAHASARLVGDTELARELSAIPYVSTATVFFAVDKAAVAHDLRGFGFIVPPGEADVLAATWVSSKWEGRAPGGTALIRAFVGGARDPSRVVRSSDDELVELAKSELERVMGSLGAPLFTRVYRYVDASPQPLVDHPARVARIRQRAGAIPGLYIAGAAFEGVGIPDCIRQAKEAAARVVSELVDGGPVRAAR